jgi:hypothetical protein
VNDPGRWQTSDGRDDDAIFADIVAHLNDDTEAERAPQPPTEEAATDGEAGDQEADSAPSQAPNQAADNNNARDEAPAEEDQRSIDQAPVLPTPLDPLAPPPPQAWRAHQVDDEDEGHFEPPPMAPLPVGDLQFWAIIIGMGGGPLLLLYVVYFNRDASSFWLLAAIAMSLGGFALLVSRLPGQHEDDDDGARL